MTKYTIKQLIVGELIGSHIETIASMETINDAKTMVNYLIYLNKDYDDYAIFDDNSQAVWRKYEQETWS